MADGKKGSIVFNFDREQVAEALKASGKDTLVVNQVIEGREFKVLEVTRGVGPLALDDTNNNLC